MLDIDKSKRNRNTKVHYNSWENENNNKINLYTDGVQLRDGNFNFIPGTRNVNASPGL